MATLPYGDVAVGPPLLPQALDLSQTGLASFPPELIQMPRLRVLNLSTNRLEALPAEVAEMRMWVGGSVGRRMAPS